MRPALTVKPELTLPEAAAQALRVALAKAEVYLEYGSGGSTVLASEMPGKAIFSVESDADWAAGLGDWLSVHPGASPVTLHHADIGPVREWGYPVDYSKFAAWPAYPHSVWERPDFQQPDLVLIDGRFRAACFATVALRTQKPVTVLFDDYRDRKDYHTVRRLAQPVEMIGRMARFELSPMTLPRALAGWYAGLFFRAR
ncbi:hypothetical protein EG244_12620 [Falsigemmobacter faecalis]|uniref:Class I SAM-dependent methyltransferase n=1 Tax=Falsigemmobacter faecalis TaxID=2488730 RepID=A0A3P3DH19_9RHOB|nr:hypothetical protein EG244_12620 [Falsigemmobacter faecalis]